MRLNTISPALCACLMAIAHANLIERALPTCTGSTSKALSILKGCPSPTASSYCDKLLPINTVVVTTTVTPPPTTQIVTSTVSSGTTIIKTITAISTITTTSTDTETFIDTVMKRAVTTSSCNLSKSFQTYPASMVRSACWCYKSKPVKTLTSTVTAKASIVTATSTLSTLYTETSTVTESSVTTQTDLTTTTEQQCTASPTFRGCEPTFPGGMVAICGSMAVPSAGQSFVSTTAGVDLGQCGDFCCRFSECYFVDYAESGGLCTAYDSAPSLTSGTGVAVMTYSA